MSAGRFAVGVRPRTAEPVGAEPAAGHQVVVRLRVAVPEHQAFGVGDGVDAGAGHLLILRRADHDDELGRRRRDVDQQRRLPFGRRGEILPDVLPVLRIRQLREVGRELRRVLPHAGRERLGGEPAGRVEQVEGRRVDGAEHRPVGVDRVLHVGPRDRHERRRAFELHEPRRLLGEEDRRRRGAERRGGGGLTRLDQRRQQIVEREGDPRLRHERFRERARFGRVGRCGGGELRVGDLDVGQRDDAMRRVGARPRRDVQDAGRGGAARRRHHRRDAAGEVEPVRPGVELRRIDAQRVAVLGDTSAARTERRRRRTKRSRPTARRARAGNGIYA